MTTAITRPVPDGLARCELTHLPRRPIDVARARAQHADYEAALVAAGCRLVRLAALPDHPDSVFVEDTAIVLDELAVVTRPGAASRRGETRHLDRELAPWRRTIRLPGAGALDGGDVLRIGRTLYVGRSARTDEAGIAALADLTAPHGYAVRPVAVSGCLHLKSAVTAVSPDQVVVNPDWVDPAAFAPMMPVEIDPAEPFAANVVWVNDVVIMPSAHPGTARRLERRGRTVVQVNVSELALAEGGVTCCSLLIPDIATG